MSVDPVSLGQSLSLLDEMYEQFRRDPDSVDPALRELFGAEPVSDAAQRVEAKGNGERRGENGAAARAAGAEIAGPHDEERRESRAREAPESAADKSKEARLPEPAGAGDAPISAEATRSTRGAGSNGQAARVVEADAEVAPSAEAGPPFGIWPLVHAYRSIGHQAANLDPLGLLEVPDNAELDPAHHGGRAGRATSARFRPDDRGAS